MFLPPVESFAMQNIINRLFLSIRLGGDGMINSEDTRETAYIGLRRAFMNLNMHTTLPSPKESPAFPPQHPSTNGLLPTESDAEENF